nr:MAG TPA: hypothetical protein [Bacteriophage sp.]
MKRTSCPTNQLAGHRSGLKSHKIGPAHTGGNPARGHERYQPNRRKAR